jgi:hypothetical protein
VSGIAWSTIYNLRDESYQILATILHELVVSTDALLQLAHEDDNNNNNNNNNEVGAD